MASFTLKLGNLDLSDYTRVAQGEGFDPLDGSGFLDPQFSESVVAEGAPLVYVNAGNREMQFPLFLKGANKDALHALMRSINVEIANTRPLMVEWKDVGASASTFYDVTYARFDPDYNFRRAGANWLGGILHVWCQPPYGHTGTSRIVATGAGSGAFLLLPFASIAGDQPALVEAEIRTGANDSWDGKQIAISAISHPSWVAKIPAASFLSPLFGGASPFIASIAGASGAPGSQAYSFKPLNTIENPWTSSVLGPRGRNLFQIPLSPSIHTGGVRVLANCRAGLGIGWGLSILNQDGTPISPISRATGWRGFSLVDLGVIRVPSQSAATIPYTVRLDYVDMPTNNGAPLWNSSVINPNALGDPWIGQIAEIYLLPEDTTQLYVDSPREAVVADGFAKTIQTATGGLNDCNRSDAYGNAYASNANPWFLDDSNNEGLTASGSALKTAKVALGNYVRDAVAEMSFEASFLSGTTPNAALGMGFFARDAVDDGYGVFYGRNAAGTGYLAVGRTTVGYTPNPNYGYASMGIPSLGPGIASGGAILRLRKQGAVLSGALEYLTAPSPVSLLASISASHASWDGVLGKFGFAANASSFTDPATNLTGGYFPYIHGFRAHTLPSLAYASGMLVDVDSVARSAIVKSSGGSYMRTMFGQRGNFITAAAPSTAAIVIIQQGMDAPSDTVSAVVRLRERFTFVR